MNLGKLSLFVWLFVSLEFVRTQGASNFVCEIYRGQCDRWCGFCSLGGLQRCSDVFPVSRCLFALRHYDAGGKRTLEGAERLAVTARTITETAFSAFTLETSEIVKKPLKPWRKVLEFNENLIRGIKIK
ncbi:uncharacterized protein LOC141885621 [Acropora palmata]|uniref:uncharacterized protein LOC141885621 n=1 Tax=Acropora palmata TaxID=6131 RepID=UPI003DA17C00